MKLTYSYAPGGIEDEHGQMTGPAMIATGTHEDRELVAIAVLDRTLGMEDALYRARDECRQAAIDLVSQRR